MLHMVVSNSGYQMFYTNYGGQLTKRVWDSNMSLIKDYKRNTSVSGGRGSSRWWRHDCY